jgi:hypothetical protein
MTRVERSHAGRQHAAKASPRGLVSEGLAPAAEVGS